MKKSTFVTFVFALIFGAICLQSCATSHGIGKVGEGCGTRIAR
jgi:predicted small secreted protein